MKKLLSLLILCCAANTVCAAPPTDAAIDELLRVTKAEQMLDATMSSMDQVMRSSVDASLQGRSISEEQRRMLDSMIKRVTQVMRDELTFASMRPMYLQIYQESFTQEEINGLIDFYKSPAGLAFTNKMPVVAQKSMLIMQSKMAPMVQKMQTAMKQAIEDLKMNK